MATNTNGSNGHSINPPRDNAGRFTEYRRDKSTPDAASMLGFGADPRWPVDADATPTMHVPPRGPQPTFVSLNDTKNGFYLPTPEPRFDRSVSRESAAAISALVVGINNAKAQANISLARWDSMPEGAERDKVEASLEDLHNQISAGKQGLDGLVGRLSGATASQQESPVASEPSVSKPPLDLRVVHTQQRELDDEERAVIRSQIGAMNVLAISGGRWSPLRDGIEMPAGKGYLVRVHLDRASDTYTVERVFAREVNGQRKEWLKGRKEGVYCDEVGEQAYRASCYVSYDESEW